MKEFGQRLRSVRKQRGLTQSYVGAVMGVSRVAVGHYEHGRNYPELQSLIEFCRETNVSMDWLVMGREPAGQFDKRIVDLPESLRLYVLQSLLLAERVQTTLAAKFMQAPTTDNYVQFSRYLDELARSLAKDPSSSRSSETT